MEEKFLVVPSISIDQRLEALYAKLLGQFGSNGRNTGRIQFKILRGFGLLVNDGAGPQVQLCQLQANPVGGTLYPAQVLLAQTDAYIFCGAAIGVVKAAAAANLKEGERFQYADITTFPLASSQGASVQSFFNSGLVSLNVNTEPVMQPLSMDYFEQVPTVQAAAGTRAAKAPCNQKFNILPDDFGIAGGNQNFFSFDLTNCLTTAISPSAANYVWVETIGYAILNGNSEAILAARANQLCI